MNAEHVAVEDFETGALEATDDPVERARGVCAGEDVLVHEQAPGDISERSEDAGAE